MKNCTLLILVLITCFSCKEEVKNENLGPFFNLTEYVDQLDLVMGSQTVERLVKINEELEVVELPDFDLQSKISYLKEFDIDKPRFYDKYSVKETGAGNIYTAIDADLKVRELAILKLGATVVRIEIKYLSKTIISKLSKEIVFAPGSELTIINETKSLVGKDKRTEMKWTW